MLVLKIIFWCCLFIVFYTYLGYGILLYCLISLKRLVKGKSQPSPVLPTDDELPTMTLMICAYNEQDIVAEKMENTHALDYPKDKFRVMWVTDGSTDQTNALLAAYPEVQVVYSPERLGKTAALKHGLREVKTDYVAFTDANTMINPGAMREIARQFQDKTVGCVSGEKRVAAHHGEMAAEGEGLYWRYESTLKKWDSELYSAMGAAGELYAVRPELCQEVPDNALLDDFMMSMLIVHEGYRIAYTPEAYALEYGSANIFEESKRKRRIAAGGLQSIWWLRKMLNPLHQPLVAFQYISHRVLRWSLTPVAMVILLIANILLATMGAGVLYTILLSMQIVFYLTAILGWLLSRHGYKNKLLYTVYYFLFMNLNVFRGMAYLSSHRHSGTWEKARRS